MNKRQEGRVVILGGYGAFGSLISEQLAKISDVVIAGRNPATGRAYAKSIGADFVMCDARDQASLKSAIAGSLIAINASGPFRPEDFSIPKFCIEQNCHYIDLADDREYVAGFNTLDPIARQRRVFACTGASTTPAVTSALIATLRPHFPRIESIHVYLSAGNKNKPGISTFESILSYAGQPIRVWEDGRWRQFPGWGLSQTYVFPQPVGKRLVQLCNVPDLELFPKLFEADEVVFKAGVELSLFNIALSVLAGLKQLLRFIELPRLAKPLVALSKLFNRFGSYSGGVMVTIQGPQGRNTIGIVTSQNGPRIPTSPAVILAARILREGPPAIGAYPCVGFISLEEFRTYLSPFGISFVLPV